MWAGDLTSLSISSGNRANNSSPHPQGKCEGLNGMLPTPRCPLLRCFSLAVLLLSVREGSVSADLGMPVSMLWLGCQAGQLWLELPT